MDATPSSSGLYKEDILQEIINLFSDVDELNFAESSELVLQIKSEE